MHFTDVYAHVSYAETEYVRFLYWRIGVRGVREPRRK